MKLQLIGGPCDGEEVFVGEAPNWYDRLETNYLEVMYHRYVPLTGPAGVYRYTYIGLLTSTECEQERNWRKSPTEEVDDEE